MSQFIEIPKNVPLEPPVILKGILSKVIEPSRAQKEFLNSNSFQKSMNFTNSQSFYKTRTQKRFVQQIKLADQLQHIVINKEYQTMKVNLNKYGRSKSFKIMNIVKDKRQSQYFDSQEEKQNQLKKTNKNNLNPTRSSMTSDILSIIKKQQRQAKLRYSIGNIYSYKDTHDRIVFVDRKYNKEFALKRSSLIETEQIMMNKKKYVSFLSKYKKKDPLVQQAIAKRKKYHSSYEKQPIQSIGIFRKNEKNNMSYKPKNTNKFCQNNFMNKQNMDQTQNKFQNKIKERCNQNPFQLFSNLIQYNGSKKSLLTKKNKMKCFKVQN